MSKKSLKHVIRRASSDHRSNRDVIDISEDPATRTKEVTIKGKTDTRTYTVPYTARMKVAEGDMIHRGAPLTEGSIDPKQIVASSRCIIC